MPDLDKTRAAAVPEPVPWNKLPGESAKAYYAFRRYAAMGPDGRSLRKLAKLLGRGEGASWLKEWSSTHGWVARAAALDLEQLRIDTAYEDRRKLVGLALDKALNDALDVLAKANDEMTTAEAIAVIDKVERLERRRQSLDQPAKSRKK